MTPIKDICKLLIDTQMNNRSNFDYVFLKSNINLKSEYTSQRVFN